MIDAPALTPMTMAGRLPLLRQRLVAESIDGLLVSNLNNIRYLTGFSGSSALLLVTRDEVVFVTDGRYRDQAADEVAAAGVEARVEITGADQRDVLSEAASPLGRLGLEADSVTWAQHRRYADSWFPDTALVATDHLVEGLRRLKDPGEVARIEMAASIADNALAQMWPALADGLTEREFGLQLDLAMRRLGADDVSFETIIASGPNGAKPHARPGGRVIANGDLVVIDFGALVDGYHSDMTRTAAVGAISSAQSRMLDVVAEAQAAGVAAIGPGVASRDVDAVCRTVIEDAGWGEAFLHSAGHGVGLDIHEAPRVASTADSVLEVGEIVTVEPGVYLPEHGGVRIEDTVLVTDDGCRALTHASKATTVRYPRPATSSDARTSLP